ncbi:hypothetical protein NP493_1421g01020, partial [Ridgeia piscesae]
YLHVAKICLFLHRWTVIETCAARVYEQFDAIEKMYSEATLSNTHIKEGDNNRLFRLVTQFSSHSTRLLKLKLLFLQHVAADIPKKWYTETQATENGEHDVLLDVSTYWSHVGELKVLKIQNGSMVSVPRFPLLSKLSMALLSIHQRC